MFYTFASFNAQKCLLENLVITKTKLLFMLMIVPDLYSLKQVVFPKFKFSK